MYEELTKSAHDAVCELLEAAKLLPGDIFLVGCSSSEIVGHKIGTDSNEEVAAAVFEGIYPELKERGIFLAVQCCEHLNRAIILEEEAADAYGLDPVNAVPHKKAGGSFATKAYQEMDAPVAVEEIHCAKAGMDIGDTLIGMHMAKVCVPVRVSVKEIGKAHLVCARTRPKFIGGSRALYNDDLK